MSPGIGSDPSEALGLGPGPVPLGLAFVAGVGAFYLIPDMPPPWVGWSLVPLTLALAVPRGPRMTRLLVLSLAGALWAMWDAQTLIRASLPDRLAQVPLTVEGRIDSIPADMGLSRRFVFRVDRAESPTGPIPCRGRVRLVWYAGPKDLVAGERWRLPVRLKPRHGYENPGGFDYERWLFEQGILATGSVRRGADAVRLDAGPGPEWLTRVRQSIAGHLARVLGERPALGPIQALTVGERSGIDPDQWRSLTLTGTNHLVAISGLHVGLVAAAVFLLVRRLWPRAPALALALAAPRAAALAGALAAVAYSGLAGFAFSTERALIMLAVVLGALGWERTLRPWRAWVLALTLTVAMDPRALLSYGAWLSFGAVAVLLFALGQRLPARGLWSRWGRAQWAVGIGLVPLLLLLFGRVSPIAPLANLVAVPLFSLALLPLVLGAALLSYVPGLESPLVWTADLLELCLSGLGHLAELPWASASIGERPLWVWPAALLGAALLLAPRGLPGRWLGMVLALPLVLRSPPRPAAGEVWLSLLDVGQGLSAVVQTAGGTLVFDAGPGYEGGMDTGSVVVAPFLISRGIDRVDRLVLSHADRDHIGGAAGLVARVAADRVSSGEPGAVGIPGARPCLAGESWVWSGARMTFLYPFETGAEGNDASCVLRVEAGGRAVLFTGDIGKGVERRLVARYGDALKSDVLVAGHHGSAGSTGAEFLDAVRPRLVLYSAGYANRFGFPARTVSERVAARGIASLSTGDRGAVELRIGKDGALLGPWGWRETRGRLWTHRPGRAEGR